MIEDRTIKWICYAHFPIPVSSSLPHFNYGFFTQIDFHLLKCILKSIWPAHFSSSNAICQRLCKIHLRGKLKHIGVKTKYLQMIKKSDLVSCFGSVNMSKCLLWMMYG